jgi:hypothetical protein
MKPQLVHALGINTHDDLVVAAAFVIPCQRATVCAAAQMLVIAFTTITTS